MKQTLAGLGQLAASLFCAAGSGAVAILSICDLLNGRFAGSALDVAMAILTIVVFGVLGAIAAVGYFMLARRNLGFGKGGLA